MLRPMFTVAMPTLDRGWRALAAVKNALAESHEPQLFELLVLDNASTVEVESYRKISEICDPRLRYIRREQTQSYHGQILQLLKEAQGEYILFMSDEDHLCPKSLERLQTHLREFHEAVLYWKEPDHAGDENLESGFISCYYLSDFVADISNSERTQELLRLIPDETESLQSYIYTHKLVAFLVQMLSAAPVGHLSERFNRIGIEEKLERQREIKLRKMDDPGLMSYRQVQARLDQLLDWLKLFERYEPLISSRYSTHSSSQLLEDALIQGIAMTVSAVLFEEDPLTWIKRLTEEMHPVFALAKTLKESYVTFSLTSLSHVEQKFRKQVRYIRNHIERMFSRIPQMLSSLHADHRRLVIYGTGYIGRTLYQYRNQLDREIFCFCDRQGLSSEPSSNPLHAIRPDKLATFREPMDIVIAATSGQVVRSIRADLRAIGITEGVTAPFLPFRKVVITGATSMIGKALIDFCIQQDVEVLALVRPRSPRLSELPDSPLLKIASCPLDALRTYVGDNERYDVFFHLGWSRTDRDGRKDMELQSENIGFTLDALQLAKRLGCKCFIGAGSQAEYGPAEGVITEQTLTAPVTAYGKAKLQAGNESRKLAEELGIRYCWARIFSVYGPLDRPDTLITGTIVRLLADRPTAFTSLTRCWNYLYVRDAAVALYGLAEYGQNGETYNVAGEETRLLREYVEELFKAMGKAVQGIGTLPEPDNQAVNPRPEIHKIQLDTGFIQITPFSKGIRETIRWYQERLKTEKEEEKDGDLSV